MLHSVKRRAVLSRPYKVWEICNVLVHIYLFSPRWFSLHLSPLNSPLRITIFFLLSTPPLCTFPIHCSRAILRRSQRRMCFTFSCRAADANHFTPSRPGAMLVLRGHFMGSASHAALTRRGSDSRHPSAASAPSLSPPSNGQ